MRKWQGACEVTPRAFVTHTRSREPLELVTSRNVQRMPEYAVVLTIKGAITFFCNNISAGVGEGMKHLKETKRAYLADAAGSLTCQPPNSAIVIKVDSSVLESYTPSIASRKQIWYEDIWNALWNKKCTRRFWSDFRFLSVTCLTLHGYQGKTSLHFPHAR